MKKALQIYKPRRFAVVYAELERRKWAAQVSAEPEGSLCRVVPLRDWSAREPRRVDRELEAVEVVLDAPLAAGIGVPVVLVARARPGELQDDLSSFIIKLRVQLRFFHATNKPTLAYIHFC